MKITIIGSGNVGGALAQRWALAGHEVVLGVRDPEHFKGQELVGLHGIRPMVLHAAINWAEVILVAAVPTAAISIAESIGSGEGKVIIDAMNSVRAKPEGYNNSTEVFAGMCNEAHIVKCFNTTGFENMLQPRYGEVGLDLFMSGDDAKAKEVAHQLALDAGFGQCYNFGGSAQWNLQEQFALAWINLAIIQGMGRDVGFKLLRR